MCNVNGTGKEFVGLSGQAFLGPGITGDVFHMIAVFFKLNEAWKT